MIAAALDLTAVFLTLIALTISLLMLWTSLLIGRYWIVWLVLGFLGAFSIVLLIKEIFFSEPYASWTALFAVIGLLVTLTLGTTLPMFIHLNSRIDQLYQQLKK